MFSCFAAPGLYISQYILYHVFAITSVLLSWLAQLLYNGPVNEYLGTKNAE